MATDARIERGQEIRRGQLVAAGALTGIHSSMIPPLPEVEAVPGELVADRILRQYIALADLYEAEAVA